jgi:hypothetical protein
MVDDIPDMQKKHTKPTTKDKAKSILGGTGVGALGGGLFGAGSAGLVRGGANLARYIHSRINDTPYESVDMPDAELYSGGIGAGLGSAIGAYVGNERLKPSKDPNYATKHDEWMSGGIHEANPVAETISGSLGRLGALLNLSPIMSLSTLQDPDKAKAEDVYETMKKVRPQELGNTRVNLKGPNFSNDIYRTLMNPRSSVLGKGLGMLGLPLAWTSMLTRGNHYNPYSDSVGLYADNKGIESHELGHAIDFNKRKPADKWLKRQGQGALRDAYGMLYGLSLGTPIPAYLWHEAQANMKSWKALQEAYKDDPIKLKEMEAIREKVLPAGMGSYIGHAASRAGAPMIGPLTGMIGGKLYGMAKGHNASKELELMKKAPKHDEDKEKDKDKKETKSAAFRARAVFSIIRYA